MYLRFAGRGVVVSALVLTSILCASAPGEAQEKIAPPSKSSSAEAKAAWINAGLRDAINHGANLFNVNGDYAGCYRTFQGALIAVRPYLSENPDLLREVDEAMKKAEKLPRVVDRAFALRKAIDSVRSAFPVKTAGKTPNKLPSVEPKKKTETLWDRLGGEVRVAQIVDQFIRTAGEDPAVNATRDGKFDLDDEKVAKLKDHVVNWISSVSGGPLKYKGESMAKAHKGMNIKNSEFDAAAKHMRKAFADAGVKAADVNAIMAQVEATRKAIVAPVTPKTEPKKTEPKKTEPKKTEPKKSEPKTEPKKTEPKKTEPKKTEPKKTEPKTKVEPKAPNVGGLGENEGALSGKITVDGKAVAGNLTLISDMGKKMQVKVDADGSFSVAGPIPLGVYRIAVDGAGIPATYGEGTTSLVVRIVQGQQGVELNLQSAKK